MTAGNTPVPPGGRARSFWRATGLACLGAALALVAATLVPLLLAPAVPPGSWHFPFVRLEGFHAEESDRGVPFRWSGPRARILVVCTPFAAPRSIELRAQPEPGGRGLAMTAVVAGHAVHTIRTPGPLLRIDLPAAGCKAGHMTVELRSRVAVPPGDGRVLGFRLLGGEVRYEAQPGTLTTWVRSGGMLGLVVAVLLVTGAATRVTRSTHAVLLAAATALVCVAAVPAFLPLAGGAGLAVGTAWVGTRLWPSGRSWALANLAATLVILASAALMVSSAVDLPRQDEWPEIVHRLRLVETGQWQRMDWFAQSSQHRHAVPRVVLVGLAWLTDWSAVATTWVALLVHLVGWLSVAWLLRAHLSPVALVGLTSVWFSPGQYESFLWGWALHGGLTLALSLLALVALEHPRVRGGLALAAAACALASFSTAPGLASWVACALLLALRRRWRALVVFVPLAIACALAYFIGYATDSQYEAMQFRLLADVARAEGARVILGLLAQPMALPVAGSPFCGAAMLVLGLASFAVTRGMSPPTLALLLLGVAWWWATALGRYDGTASVLAISRYGWTVLPLWGWIAATNHPRPLRVAAVALTLALGATGWGVAVPAVSRWRAALETRRDAIFDGHTAAGADLYWAPEALPEMIADLRRWEYSLYRRARLR